MFKVVWFAVLLLLFAADVAEAGCRRGGGRFRNRGCAVQQGCRAGAAMSVSGGCSGGSCSVR